MFIYVAVFLLQLLVGLHVFRTGRPVYWVFIVVMVPVLGMLLYLLVEILPGVFGSATVRRAAQKVQDTVDPERAYRKLKSDEGVADTAEAKLQLAREAMRIGRLDEAERLLDSALTGFHADDPTLLLELAAVRAELGDWQGTAGALDKLDSTDSKVHMHERTLLRARVAEAEGQSNEARRLFEGLLPHFAGAEARYRFAHFLHGQGEVGRARKLLQEILDASDRSPRSYRDLNHYWIAEARRVLKAI